MSSEVQQLYVIVGEGGRHRGSSKLIFEKQLVKFSCKIRKEAISQREPSELNLALRLMRDGKDIPRVGFSPTINILLWNIFSLLPMFLIGILFFYRYYFSFLRYLLLKYIRNEYFEITER